MLIIPLILRKFYFCNKTLHSLKIKKVSATINFGKLHGYYKSGQGQKVFGSMSKSRSRTNFGQLWSSFKQSQQNPIWHGVKFDYCYKVSSRLYYLLNENVTFLGIDHILGRERDSAFFILGIVRNSLSSCDSRVSEESVHSLIDI